MKAVIPANAGISVEIRDSGTTAGMTWWYM